MPQPDEPSAARQASTIFLRAAALALAVPALWGGIESHLTGDDGTLRTKISIRNENSTAESREMKMSRKELLDILQRTAERIFLCKSDVSYEELLADLEQVNAREQNSPGCHGESTSEMEARRSDQPKRL